MFKASPLVLNICYKLLLIERLHKVWKAQEKRWINVIFVLQQAGQHLAALVIIMLTILSTTLLSIWPRWCFAAFSCVLLLGTWIKTNWSSHSPKRKNPDKQEKPSGAWIKRVFFHYFFVITTEACSLRLLWSTVLIS